MAPLPTSARACRALLRGVHLDSLHFSQSGSQSTRAARLWTYLQTPAPEETGDDTGDDTPASEEEADPVSGDTDEASSDDQSEAGTDTRYFAFDVSPPRSSRRHSRSRRRSRSRHHHRHSRRKASPLSSSGSSSTSTFSDSLDSRSRSKSPQRKHRSHHRSRFRVEGFMTVNLPTTRAWPEGEAWFTAEALCIN